MRRIEIENLAVQFRVNCPNLHHVSVHEVMTQLGLGVMYGFYCGTPRHHRNKRRKLREQIAETLSQLAKKAI
jgi:hypothetical protein